METKSEIQTALASIQTSVLAVADVQTRMQKQLDAVDKANQLKIANQPLAEDTLTKSLEESDSLRHVIENQKGRAVVKIGDLNGIRMERKILTSVGAGMTGVGGIVQPQRVGPSVVPLAQRRLYLRDLLFRGSRTTSNAVYFLKELTFNNAASPQQGEGSMKAESTATYTSVNVPVQTISHWLNMSKQLLQDSDSLATFISNKLIYGLLYREELQILSGDGTGNNLFGLLGQAAPFNTALLNGGAYTNIDVLRRALEQVELADETSVGFFVLSPSDCANIDCIKDANGNYVVGRPSGASGPLTLWGVPLVSTTAMTPGVFLAGSSESAELHDRMDAVVELSFEERENFVRNAVTLLCESRTALTTYRPAAFVTGNLTNSPQ